MLLLMMLFLLLSRLPIKMVWNSTRMFILLFPVGFMIMFSLLLWDIHKGVVDGFFFALRFIILALSSTIFAMSTSPRDLMLSLTKMKVPYELAFMLTIAIRFVPVITREIHHVIDAQKARAHKMMLSFRRPVESMQSFLPIIIPTLHLLLIKAFDLSISIEARAFRAMKTRTFPPRLRFTWEDWIAFVLLGGLGYYLILN